MRLSATADDVFSQDRLIPWRERRECGPAGLRPFEREHHPGSVPATLRRRQAPCVRHAICAAINLTRHVLSESACISEAEVKLERTGMF